MDLIYTNSERVDKGVLSAYAFDLSYGASENDFAIVIGTAEAMLDYGAFIYMEGTEYGGIVDAKQVRTNSESITYMGRTWHGVLNSKIIEPDSGENYCTVSGDANAILSLLIARMGLSELFTAKKEAAGIDIVNYQFHRYCKGYDGIADMLSDNGAKLKLAWKNQTVELSAVPIVDYTENPIDGDITTMTVEQHERKVNHLVCLGKGELTEREVLHLYVDRNGNIGDTQYYTGVDEVTEKYENNNTEDLRSDGIKRLKELRDNDKAEITLPENDVLTYDIGDIVEASDVQTGVTATASVTQKIVRINNGAINTEYKTGR